MEQRPVRSTRSYKVPFLIALAVCLLLAAAVLILLLSHRPPQPEGPVGVTEGEIIEIVNDTLQSRWLLLKRPDGSTCSAIISTRTELFDAAGKPALASGLSVGMRLKITHNNTITLESMYKEDGTPLSPILRDCYEVRILP